MKRILLFLLTLIVSYNYANSQTSMGTGTLTQCGGTYLDPGGAANYPDNANQTQTICPGTAGECITLMFTAFNLENNWDYLYIYDGNSIAAPLVATLTGTTLPGNITSTTGCLTLRFTSDGIINAPGWTANVICNPCGAPPPPPPGPAVASDCNQAVNVCTNASFQVDPNGSGNIVEFTSGSFTNPSINPASLNSGCLLSGELNSTWMVVNIATTGTLEFSFGADGGSNCYDWIMWPYNGLATCNQIINNTLQPIRCNWNGFCEGFTGVATPLPPGGDASNFEPEINVVCGQQYLICLSNFSSATTSVPLNFYGTAQVSCGIFTPITVNNATICPGETATLTATGGNTYSWSPGGMTTATVNVSPATTTTYTVTGTGSCGTGTATSTVTVLPANDPLCFTACTATATNTGPYCVGATIQLNGTGGGTYSWTGPNGFTSTLQNPTLPATAAAAGTYTLTTNLSGCIATATTTVVINPLPLVNAGPDAAYCVGGSTTLTGSGANTYVWSPATGLSGTTTASVTASPAATTTYTLTGTSAAGCVNTDQVIVTVNPLPTVIAGPNQTVCAGTSVTLSATGASTYSWNNGVTQGVPFTPASTQTYTVTGTSTAGCVNTSTVTVTVNPIPAVNAGPDVSICAGGSTTLTATGAATYSWAPGGQTTASITVSPTANTTYTVTGTSLGCVATDAVLVSILSNAPINAGPDVAICAGQSTTLTATGGVTYNWNNGLGAGAAHSVSPAATTTYTVTGTDANGCIGTDGIVVTVNPNPSPVINGASEYCPGNFSVLSTTLPYNSYNWSTGSTSASINSTEANNPITVSVTNNFGCSGVSPAFTVSENNSITTNLSIVICQGESALIHGVNQTLSGLYSQTFVSSFGCDSISNVTLTVNPLPIVNAGNDVSVCFGESTVLNASGAVNYSWNNGGIQGSVAPTITTTYTVTGTDANGCVNTDEITVTVNPIPNVNAGPDQTICIGASVTLSATGSADTYSWNNGVTNGVAFTPGVGTVTYTVTGSTIEGCVASDQVIVAVNPLPAVFAGNNVVVCEGESVTLTASGAASYSWNNGINNGIAFVPSLGTTTYTVSGTSSAGCINTDQVDVTVNPNPEVAFIPGITLGCAPLETTFTNLTTDAVNCVWTFSNGTVLTGCGTVPVTFTQSGCYDATLTTTSANGCSSSFTATNIVCVEEAPIAAFTPSSNNLSTLNPLIDFTNQTTGASNYVWSFGDDSGISTDVNPSHLYPNDVEGEYMVTLIAYSPLGCVDTAYSFIQIYEELIFYVPNTFTPDIDNYNPVFQPVFTSGFDPYSYNLMIFNRWGEVVFESNNAEIGWNGSYGNNGQIEMCQDGVYTWKIEFKVTRWDERRQVVGHVNLIR